MQMLSFKCRCRVGAETLQQVYGVTVDPDEFRAFAGMGEAYFLSGVAGKYGVHIEDINMLKEIYYGIYLDKAADPSQRIGLPGRRHDNELGHHDVVQSIVFTRPASAQDILPEIQLGSFLCFNYAMGTQGLWSLSEPAEQLA